MAENSLSLQKLTIYYTVGNLTSRVIRFALFFVYTFFLTKADLGFFDLITNTITLITPVLALQLYDAILRWNISDSSEGALKGVATVSMFVVLFCLLIFTFIYFITAAYIKLEYTGLIYCSIIVQTIYPVILQFARGCGKNLEYTISGVLFTIVFAVGTVIILMVFKLKVEGLLIANVVATLAAIFYLVIKLNYFKYLVPSFFNKEIAKEMLHYSVPLIPNTISWWAISTADRYIILYYLGISFNGLFAVATKFPSMLLMLHSIFNMAWQEKAMRTYNAENRDEYYSSILDKYFTFFFCGIMMAIAVTKPLFRVAIQAAYYDAWKLMPLMYLAIGYQALASFYGSGYLSSKKTSGALTTTIVGVVVSVTSNFILIPLLGLIGASVSFCAGFFIMFIIRVYQTRRYFSIKFPIKKFIILNVLIAITSLITISENIFVLCGNIMLAIVAFVVFNKKNLSFYLSGLRLKGKDKLAIVNT